MTFEVSQVRSILRDAVNLPGRRIGHHLSLRIPIVLDDDRGALHALEHVLVTSAHLVERADAMHVEDFNAHTTPAAVSLSFSSACVHCFHAFGRMVMVAVFRSAFTEEDVHREVCRPVQGGDTIPGVIVNEMRGTLWREQRQLALAIRRCAFSGASYAFNSGGEPDKILTLRHDELRLLYRQWFVPERATLLTVYDGDADALVEMLTEGLDADGVGAARPAVDAGLGALCSLANVGTYHAQFFTPSVRDYPLRANIWRFDDYSGPRDRVLLALLFQYALRLPGAGLLSALQRVPGFAGFAGFNGLEWALPVPVLVLTMAKFTQSESVGQAINAVILQFLMAPLDVPFLQAVGNEFLMENTAYPLSGESAGGALLRRLRTHVELGHDPGLFGGLEACVADCIAQLSSHGEISRLVKKLLMGLENSALLQLEPVCRIRPPSTPSLLHHANPPAEQGFVPSTGCKQSSGAGGRSATPPIVYRLGSRSFVAAGTNGVTSVFRIMPVSDIDRTLVDFLPFYSKYASEVRFPTSDSRASSSVLPVYLHPHDNTFYRPNPLSPRQCDVYRQTFGRCTERDLPLLERYIEQQTEGLRYVEAKKVQQVLNRFAVERREAVARHGLALALVQASKSHSLSNLYKTRSTGLECLGWVSDPQRHAQLVEETLLSVSKLWERAQRADLIVATDPFRELDSCGRAPVALQRLASIGAVVPAQFPEWLDSTPTRELWRVPTGGACVVAAWSVPLHAPCDWLCFKIAEQLLNQSGLVPALRAGGGGGLMRRG